jgi:serine O-acetyltransferase
VPTIGDEVWIGANAVIVGGIKIGNNVLVAPNSYINFDVPNHSVVLGNPASIIPNDHATEGYINNKI